MYSKHFKTEALMLEWANDIIKGGLEGFTIISVVKDVSNGDWIIFYKL